MKKRFGFITVLLIGAAFAFVSCTTEICITAKDNNSVQVTFNGAAGLAFKELVHSATGTEGDTVIFDLKQISYELAKNGFSDVNVDSKTGSDLNINMSDEGKKSALFTTSIINLAKGKLSVNLTPAKLRSFYTASDEEITQFLDLLLAPVFNDESMSSEEYLETIASFYGEDVAEEISNTNFKVTLKHLDGKETVKSFPIAELLSLSSEVSF